MNLIVITIILSLVSALGVPNLLNFSSYGSISLFTKHSTECGDLNVNITNSSTVCSDLNVNIRNSSTVCGALNVNITNSSTVCGALKSSTEFGDLNVTMPMTGAPTTNSEDIEDISSQQNNPSKNIKHGTSWLIAFGMGSAFAIIVAIIRIGTAISDATWVKGVRLETTFFELEGKLACATGLCLKYGGIILMVVFSYWAIIYHLDIPLSYY